VTIRDYDDLTLKEGLTTYMEQAFAADMGTAEAAVMGLRQPLPAALTAASAACKAADSRANSSSGMLPLQQLLPALRAVASCRGGQGGCNTAELAAAVAAPNWRRITEVDYLHKHQV
jgi:hypothetical protein